MTIHRLPRSRRFARTALLALSTLALITCAEDPMGPATGEARLRLVPVYSSVLAPPLVIDAVHVRVARPDTAAEQLVTVYDDTVAFSPDRNTLTLRDVTFRMSEPSEDVLVSLELLAGRTVLFAGSQTVTVIRGTVNQPPALVLSYVGPGANVASLVLGPRDTTIAPGAAIDMRLDAFDSSGAAVPQYYASWSLTGGPAAGAKINAAGRLTAPSVPDTFFVKAVNLPTGSTDSTRVIVGQAAPPPPVAPSLIAGGDEFTCEIRGTTTYCWGDNGDGQLGDSSFTQRLVPTPVAGGHVFTSIATGIFHACALTAAGQAWCWGDGLNGELGNGASSSSTVPVPVSGGHAFVQLAAGDGYSCGITAQGAAWCWGGNFTGSLGNGTTTNSATPVQVSGGHRFVRITAAGQFDVTANHTCAIDDAGAAWCWGENSAGALGDGTSTRRPDPVAVTGGLTFVEISAGGTGTCGVTTGGALYCWGTGVGPGGTSPQLIPGGFAYTAVKMGDGHVCARTAAGWRCAGDNSAGQLGDGSSTPQTTPVLPSGGLAFTSLATGGAHTCGITSNGTWCWGLNSAGQIGTGQAGGSYAVPTRISNPPARVALLAGNNQSAPVSTGVTNPLTVQVFDAANAPLVGVAVRFDVQTGGGTVGGTASLSVLTDQSGTAALTSWTLGPAAGSNTLTATVEARGVTGNPVTFTATATQNTPITVTWTGAVSNVWETPGNWTPRAPTVGDNVVIPATARSPALSTTPANINNLTIQSGGSLDLGTTVLGVSGSLAADGPINGFGTNAGLVLVGTTGTVHGTVDGNVIVGGAYTLDGTLTLGFNSTGLFAVSVTGSLGLNGHTARVRGAFATAGTGTLTMTNPLDSLVVSAGTLGGGQVLFGGGSTAGRLTSGRLLVATDLVQSGDPAAFAPSGSHRTVFTGGASVALLDTVNSGFQDLDMNGQTLLVQTGLPIRGTLVAGGLSFLEMTGSNGVTANSVNVSALTVQSGPFTIGNGTITRFDSVTFAGQSPTVAQLSVRNNGAPTPFTFTALRFVATPTTGGVYLDANDLNGATGGLLTINLVSPTPATPGGFTRVTNGAVVNWPVVGTVTWTGATSIDWNTTSNWNPARIPGAGDSVVIPNGVTTFPTLSGRQTIGAMFEDGRLTITGGTLEVLRTSASNTGVNRIIQLTGATDSLIIRGDNGSPVTGTGGVYLAGGNINSLGNYQLVRLVMNGSGNQLLNGSTAGNTQIGILTINKPSGSVTTSTNHLFTGDSIALLSGGLTGGGAFQLTSGFFSAAGTTVALSSGSLAVGTTINAQGSYGAFSTTYNLQPSPAVLTVPVLPYTNLFINGSSALAGSQAQISTRMVINGNFTLTGNGGSPVTTFTLGGRTLVVNGNLTTTGLGQPRLVMTNPLDSIIVSGNATFGGGIAGNPGNLTAGTLVIGGNFAMSTQFGGANFQATGTHTTVLTATSPSVTMYLPGTTSGGNRFQNLVWTGAGTMTLGDTATVVSGTLTTTASTPVTFLGAQAGGSRLQFRAIAASGAVTFNNVPVWAVQTGTGAAIGLGTAAFVNMPTTVAQLTIQHPGIAGGLTLPNLNFATVPTSGVYISATDNVPTDPNPLVVNLTSPTPATSGGFVQTSNATVFWPFVAAVTWTGNTSTAWSVGSNWSGGVAPSATDSVVIPAATNQPSLTGPVTVAAVNVTGGVLSLGGQSLTTSRGFSTTGNGRVSSPAGSILAVGGNATFSGGDQTGLLLAGELRVSGNFTQSGLATSFVAGGTHSTSFVGTGPQAIAMADGVNSAFQNLDVSNTAAAVTLGTNQSLTVKGTLALVTGTNLTGAGFVTAGGVNGVAGSRLGVAQLTVPANNLAVQGTYAVNQTILTSGGVVPAVSYANLLLSAAGPQYSLTANLGVGGNLTIRGDLAVSGRTVNVGGDFTTDLAGTLTMTNPADLVVVAGGTSFYGGDETGKLTAGVFRTSNQFLQDATNSPTSFLASGTHTVEIISASPVNGGVNLATPATARFRNLRVLFVSSVTSDLVVDGNLEVNFNVAGNLFARRIRVGGTFTKDGIGFFGPTRLTLLGGSTVLGGTVGPDTLEFLGTAPQTFPASTFPGTVLVANDVTAPSGTGSISADLRVLAGGVFRMGTGGNTFNVGGSLSTAGTGVLQMSDAGATLAVTGNAAFAGGSTNGLLTAGTLSIGGNFTQSAVVSTTSFAPSGTHKTVFANTVARAVSMGSPGLAAAGSHFQVLDVSGATGGITLDVNMQADSLISTSTAGKISSSGVRLTARRVQVSGLGLVNTTFALDEQGTFSTENFSNVTFSGFPTPVASTTMLTVIGPGSAAAARPTITTTNVNFQSMAIGAANFYVDLTSSNGFAVNLNMTTSNQATNNGGNGAQLTKVTPATGVATVTW